MGWQCEPSCSAAQPRRVSTWQTVVVPVAGRLNHRHHQRRGSQRMSSWIRGFARVGRGGLAGEAAWRERLARRRPLPDRSSGRVTLVSLGPGSCVPVPPGTDRGPRDADLPGTAGSRRWPNASAQAGSRSTSTMTTPRWRPVSGTPRGGRRYERLSGRLRAAVRRAVGGLASPRPRRISAGATDWRSSTLPNAVESRRSPSSPRAGRRGRVTPVCRKPYVRRRTWRPPCARRIESCPAAGSGLGTPSPGDAGRCLPRRA